MSVTTIHNRDELYEFCFLHDVVLLACFKTEGEPGELYEPLHMEFQRLAQSDYDRDRVGFAKLEVKEVLECVKEFEIEYFGTLVTFYRQEKDQRCDGPDPETWQYIIKEAMKKSQH